MQHAFINYAEMNDGIMRGFLTISDDIEEIKKVHDKLQEKIKSEVLANEYAFNDTKVTIESAKERYPFINDIKLYEDIDEYITEVNENAKYHYDTKDDE